MCDSEIKASLQTHLWRCQMLTRVCLCFCVFCCDVQIQWRVGDGPRSSGGHSVQSAAGALLPASLGKNSCSVIADAWISKTHHVFFFLKAQNSPALLLPWKPFFVFSPASIFPFRPLWCHKGCFHPFIEILYNTRQHSGATLWLFC